MEHDVGIDFMLTLCMFQVREKLITKELAMEKSEKARKLRAMKKYGKKVLYHIKLAHFTLYIGVNAWSCLKSMDEDVFKMTSILQNG